MRPQRLVEDHRAPGLDTPRPLVLSGWQTEPHDSGKVGRWIVLQIAQQGRYILRRGHQLGRRIAARKQRRFPFDRQQAALIAPTDTRSIRWKRHAKRLARTPR